LCIKNLVFAPFPQNGADEKRMPQKPLSCPLPPKGGSVDI